MAGSAIGDGVRSGGSGDVRTAGELLDRLIPVAERAQRQTGTPGVVLGVLVDGQRATAGIGITALTRPRPVDESSLFRLCSITKPFLGTLAFVLRERGRLDLDRPVREYVDVQFADPAADVITARDLLQHTSGLECEIRSDLGGYGGNDDALSRLVADFRLVRQFAPPGGTWGYCNTGYWLLGAVLAAAADQPFEDAMREHVLAPLDLSDTVFRAEDAIMRDVALPHRPVAAGAVEHEQLPAFDFPRARRPSGGLVAPVHDVLSFAQAQLPEPEGAAVVPRLLGPHSLHELQTPTVTAYRPDVEWSPGWAVRGTGADRRVFHGGRNDGYRTFLTLLPERSAAVAVLTNSGAGLPVHRAVEAEVDAVVLGIEPASPEYVELSDDLLAAYEGDYWYPNVERVSVRANAGRLRISADGAPARADEWQRERLFRPVSRTQFVELSDPDEGIALTFLPGLSGSDSVDQLRLGHRLGRRAE